jgi:hypothetical protein
MKRLTYANVMATIAVFAALGGTGYAAAQLGSGAIKNNSIKSIDVKNKTLKTADFSSGARSALKGEKGEKGDPGQNGAAGANGTARAYGTVQADATLKPALSKNVVNVAKPVGFSNIYCIALAPGIDPTSVRPVASVDFDTLAGSAAGIATHGNVGSCPASTVNVITFGVAANGVTTPKALGFTFVVP